jgi:hypothetical protein
MAAVTSSIVGWRVEGGILGRSAWRVWRCAAGWPTWRRAPSVGQSDGGRLQVPAALGALAELGFERGGANQTAFDEGEDQVNIAGAEESGEEGKSGEDARFGVLHQRI